MLSQFSSVLKLWAIIMIFKLCIKVINPNRIMFVFDLEIRRFNYFLGFTLFL